MTGIDETLAESGGSGDYGIYWVYVTYGIMERLGLSKRFRLLGLMRQLNDGAIGMSKMLEIIETIGMFGMYETVARLR